MIGRYIIFADDDADDLELITGYFKQYNSEMPILEFRDGREVIRFLESFAPNASIPVLIILDLNMPRMSGKETLVYIRSLPLFKKVPVILYTTSMSKADAQFCEKYQASWVSKPPHIDGVKQVARILAEFCTLYS
jgi:CheY-like chemotaxis protein